MTLQELLVKCSTTIGFVVVGKVTPLFASVQVGHIPPMVIECFQIASYTVAIAVGLITVYKFFKK